MVNKKKLYDEATEKLVKQVETMYLPAEFQTKYDLTEMVRRFRETFKNPSLRRLVLNPKYEKERVHNARFSAGFCGIASYTWNHLFRMPDRTEIWRLKQYSGNKTIYGLSDHVWLGNKFDGSILDLAFDQSIDEEGTFVEIPYFLGETADSNFDFKRAFLFAKRMNINLENIVFINMLMNQKI